ncbi:uncharacterized protein isoform X2 [Musca autumnalis]|uniref:uncharacterized protein isoform X2 n=1 Tax=Musca autumnalis TaxID=221902 RepID=UPI003CF9FEA6
MATSNVCRLCRTSCNDSLRLTDASGATNEIFNITIKFFNPMFLEIEKETTINQLAFLCTLCWHHISEFNNFQQSVLLLHANLHKAAESAIVVGEQLQIAENTNCNIEFISDKEVTTTADSGIKGDPEIITPNDDLQENQNTGQSLMKIEEKLDAIKPLDSTCAEYDEINNAMHVDEEEFQYEEFIIDELCDESDISDDELLEIGRSPQWSNESCDESEQCDASVDDNDVSEVPGPSRKRRDPKKNDEYIAKWRPILKCESCPKSFPTFTLLKEHFLADHPEQEFYILCCNRKLQFRSRVEEHVTFHLNPKALSCKICGYGFKTYGNLNGHMTNVHSKQRKDSARRPAGENDKFLAKWKPELKCEYCPKLFPKYSLLRKHFRTEHPYKEFYIRCCESKFKTRYRIVEHATFHINPNTFSCPLCGNNFMSKSNLKEHMATVHNSSLGKMHRKMTKEIDEYIAKWKPCLKCEYCPESFPTYTLLKMHCQDQHPDSEFYIQCCGRKFKHRFRLEAHAVTHMEAATFRCLVCGNCMGSELSLKDHMIKMHPDAKFVNGITNNEEYKYKCSQCEFCCVDEATLVQHGNFHTDRCRYCNCAFNNKESLNEHMASSHSRKSNPPRITKCEFCPKTFKNRSGLYTHFKSIHPEEFARRKKWCRLKAKK